MSPWLIVSWVAAVAVTLILVALTFTVVVSVIRGLRKPVTKERRDRQ